MRKGILTKNAQGVFPLSVKKYKHVTIFKKDSVYLNQTGQFTQFNGFYKK